MNSDALLVKFDEQTDSINMAAVDEQDEEVTCEDEEPIPLHMMCQQVCNLKISKLIKYHQYT